MKNSGKCPKCGGNDILRIPGDIRSYGSGNNIITSSAILIKGVKVTRYLCTQCGFSEEWIDRQEDIEKLKDKFS